MKRKRDRQYTVRGVTSRVDEALRKRAQGKDEEEALDNIKEAITAWLWAEDQKAVSALSEQQRRQPVIVAL